MPPKRNPSLPSRGIPIKDELGLFGPSKAFLAEHILGLIRMYAISGMGDIRAWDLIYDILFLDPITTPHFAQFQWLWSHRRENSGDNFQWWNLFKGFFGGCLGKTQEQMNHYRADNPSQFGDHGEDRLPPARGHSISGPRRTPCTPTWFPGIPKIAPPYHQIYPPARFIAEPRDGL